MDLYSVPPLRPKTPLTVETSNYPYIPSDVGKASVVRPSSVGWRQRSVFPQKSEMLTTPISIFSELSPAPKLSVWHGFKGDVLLRGCAWLKTRSVTSKRRSPSAFPALEFLPRTFFVASDLSYPTKGDGNRDAELGQRVITGRSIIKDRPLSKV
ncbi:hypothetical protein HZH66_003824 [Vespula vulgaris]|uniref:Uncharacterized protein n=1 Tax=Vespula vulgaris TaxID=7454 RepID=A0A834KDW8_VESVU|nr:hypothetical protein HZH66_003824 [Vespula vulgaris]